MVAHSGQWTIDISVEDATWFSYRNLVPRPHLRHPAVSGPECQNLRCSRPAGARRAARACMLAVCAGACTRFGIARCRVCISLAVQRRCARRLGRVVTEASVVRRRGSMTQAGCNEAWGRRVRERSLTRYKRELVLASALGRRAALEAGRSSAGAKRRWSGTSASAP